MTYHSKRQRDGTGQIRRDQSHNHCQSDRQILLDDA